MFCFGMPALIELPTVADYVTACRELELSFVELNMNLPVCCPESLTASDARALAEEADIEFTLHLPEDMDLGCLHRGMRRAHLQRAISAVEWAADAGIEIVNLHVNPGVYFTLPDSRVFIYGVYSERFLAGLEESFEELLEKARETNVTVCVENTGFLHPHMAQAVEALSEIPGFWLTWDVGHDAKSHYRDQEVLARHEDRIAHMHLHDYDGIRDHQPLYMGQLDISVPVAFARERDMRVLIEVKTKEALVQSVEGLQTHGLWP